MEGQEFCNFVGELGRRGMLHIVDKIFQTMDLISLRCAMQVSEEWSIVISNESRLVKRPTQALEAVWKSGTCTHVTRHFSEFDKGIQIDKNRMARYLKNNWSSEPAGHILVFNRCTLQLECIIEFWAAVLHGELAHFNLCSNLNLVAAITVKGIVLVWDISSQQQLHLLKDVAEMPGVVLDYSKKSRQEFRISFSSNGKFMVSFTIVRRRSNGKKCYLLTSRKLANQKQVLSTTNALIFEQAGTDNHQIQLMVDYSINDGKAILFVCEDYIVIRYECKKPYSWRGWWEPSRVWVEIRKTETLEFIRCFPLETRLETRWVVKHRLEDAFDYSSGYLVAQFTSYSRPDFISIWDVKTGNRVRSLYVNRLFDLKLIDSKYIICIHDDEVKMADHLKIWDLTSIVDNSNGQLMTDEEHEDSKFAICSIKMLDGARFRNYTLTKIVADEYQVFIFLYPCSCWRTNLRAGFDDVKKYAVIGLDFLKDHSNRSLTDDETTDEMPWEDFFDYLNALD